MINTGSGYVMSNDDRLLKNDNRILRNGNLGHALAFDGVDDHVEGDTVDNYGSRLDDMTGFTLTFWGVIENSGSGDPGMVTKYTAPASNDGFILLSKDYNAGLIYFQNGTRYNGNGSSTFLNFGALRCYVLVWDNVTGIVRGYRNNIKIFESIPIGIGSMIKNNTAPYMIGGWASTRQQGTAASVAVFNRALTESEINDVFIFEGDIPSSALADCVIDYKFNEKYGTTTRDESGNGYNGTLIDFADTSLGTSNAWVDAYTLDPIER